MATAEEPSTEHVQIDGREVAISNSDKVLFPAAGITKRDLVHYYLAVADGALRGAGGRPNMLVRYPNGIDGDFFRLQIVHPNRERVFFRLELRAREPLREDERRRAGRLVRRPAIANAMREQPIDLF